MSKLGTFDIETSGLFFNGAPPQILLLAVGEIDGGVVAHAARELKDGETALDESVEGALSDAAAFDQLYSYNGCSFDFRVLHESGFDVIDMCKKHIDIGMNIKALMGWMPSLSWILEAYQFIGNKEPGSAVPRWWMHGEYDRIVDYAAQESMSFGKLVSEVVSTGTIRFVSKRTWFTETVDLGHLLTVEEIISAHGNALWHDYKWMYGK